MEAVISFKKNTGFFSMDIILVIVAIITDS